MANNQWPCFLMGVLGRSHGQERQSNWSAGMMMPMCCRLRPCVLAEMRLPLLTGESFSSFSALARLGGFTTSLFPASCSSSRAVSSVRRSSADHAADQDGFIEVVAWERSLASGTRVLMHVKRQADRQMSVLDPSFLIVRRRASLASCCSLLCWTRAWGAAVFAWLA